MKDHAGDKVELSSGDRGSGGERLFWKCFCPRPTLERMARYFDVHPRDPQPRIVERVVALLRRDAVIAGQS